jgi:hypothetical protein
MIPNPTYADIKNLLDTAIGGPNQDIGAHGPFWRLLSRDDFVLFTYRGEPLFAKTPGGDFDVDGSNLVKALEGRLPFGRDLVPPVPGARFRRMPAGKPPMPPDDILSVRQWIKAGCPA